MTKDRACEFGACLFGSIGGTAAIVMFLAAAATSVLAESSLRLTIENVGWAALFMALASTGIALAFGFSIPPGNREH